MEVTEILIILFIYFSGHVSCSSLDFTCNNMRCIPLIWRCDGDVDCHPGGEDEWDCRK